MSGQSPISTRNWLCATLDDVGDRVQRARDAGVADPVLSWTDEHGVELTAKAHGSGVTITATPHAPEGPIRDLTMPLGWTASDEAEPES
jgi:hypothetical protein